MIIEPGIYEMDADEYHGDPCPTPSLSAGMINDILKAPAKCFHNSRRLNPNYEEPEGQEKFTVGTVSHVIFLEPETFEQKVVVCPFDDWRKSTAKQVRETAKAAGKVAILEKHMEHIYAARKAFFANRFTAAAFANGKTEQSMFWRHPVHGFWCRARPDFLADTRTHLNDYKATQDANPEGFGRHAYNLGYHRRAAWYIEGATVLFGKAPAHYWFVLQETAAPYLTSVIELDWNAIEAGQGENDRAADIFAKCLSTNEWWGYRSADNADADRAFQVGLPTYAYMQIDQRLGRDSGAWPARSK